MKPTPRLALCAPLLLLLNVACGAGGDDATGSVAGSGGDAAAAAGAASSAGGTGSGAGASAVVPLAGSGQALGGGDQGSLFPPDGVVPIMPVETGGTGGAAPTIPGDGHVAKSTLGGGISATATFTQTGLDVSIVVDITSGCKDGDHRFQIYDGLSCDSESTEGNPWSPRGTELGPDIACSGGKGKATYLRKGDDSTKNITVSDHNPETDVTTHVVILSDEQDTSSRAACGNFFF
jgi:hypothetical protein